MKPSLFPGLCFVLGAASLSAANLPAESPLAHGERVTALLAKESLGPLRLKQSEKEVIQVIGKPGKRSETVHIEADGLDVQTWFYPKLGLVLRMASSTGRNGPKFVTAISAIAKCSFATQRGIRLGSAESDVLKAYAGTEDLQHKDFLRPDHASFVVGSIFSGIVFEFTGGQVSRIFFGAAVECRTLPSA